MRKPLLLIVILSMISWATFAQNLALNASVSASASSSGSYGPSNWNDGMIGPNFYFGWLGTASTFVQPAWIQYEWTTPQTFNQIVFHPPTWSQPGYVYFMGTAQVHYWDGSTWVNHHSFQSGTPGFIDTVSLSAVTTTKVRITNFMIQGADNPGWDEIQVFNHQVVIPPSPDVAVCMIVEPSDTVTANTPVTVTALFCNTGDTVLYQIPVNYSIKGSGSVTQETWQIPAGLAVGDTMGYTFTTLLTITADTSELCIYTTLAGDVDHSNDTLCKFLYLPYDPGIGVAENAPGNSAVVQIFPQPSCGMVTVQREAAGAELLLSLMDLQGRIVLKQTMPEGVMSTEISVYQITPGVYLLHANDHRNSFVTRLVVQ